MRSDVNTINNTMNNTINNTTDREGCRDVGRDVGRDGGRVQTKTEEEGWIGRDGTSEPKGWGVEYKKIILTKMFQMSQPE